MDITTISLATLATTGGIALVVKYLIVPIVKTLFPAIAGRGTVITAIGAGIALALAYQMATHWPPIAAQVLQGIINGVIGGWAACGLQDAISAILRPEKLAGDPPPPPTSPPGTILR